MLRSFSSSLNVNYELGFGLAISSLTFLIFHELGHILDGHLSQEMLGFSQISEARRHLKSADELITSQTLEFDADCFGIASSLDCWYRGTHPKMCQPFFGTWNKVAKYARVGTHSAMKIFDILFEFDPNWGINSTHPAAWVRTYYMAMSARHNLLRAKIGGQILDPIGDNKDDPAHKVEVAYFVMTK